MRFTYFGEFEQQDLAVACGQAISDAMDTIEIRVRTLTHPTEATIYILEVEREIPGEQIIESRTSVISFIVRMGGTFDGSETTTNPVDRRQQDIDAAKQVFREWRENPPEKGFQ